MVGSVFARAVRIVISPLRKCWPAVEAVTRSSLWPPLQSSCYCGSKLATGTYALRWSLKFPIASTMNSNFGMVCLERIYGHVLLTGPRTR